MHYLIIAIVCFLGGGFATFIALDVKRRRIEEMLAALETQTRANQDRLKEIHVESQRVSQESGNLLIARQEFDKKVISYDELQGENGLLKTDLRNIGMSLRKLQLDREAQNVTQSEINSRVEAIGGLYLRENVK